MYSSISFLASVIYLVTSWPLFELLKIDLSIIKNNVQLDRSVGRGIVRPLPLGLIAVVYHQHPLPFLLASIARLIPAQSSTVTPSSGPFNVLTGNAADILVSLLVVSSLLIGYRIECYAFKDLPKWNSRVSFGLLLYTLLLLFTYLCDKLVRCIFVYPGSFCSFIYGFSIITSIFLWTHISLALFIYLFVYKRDVE